MGPSNQSTHQLAYILDPDKREILGDSNLFLLWNSTCYYKIPT